MKLARKEFSFLQEAHLEYKISKKNQAIVFLQDKSWAYASKYGRKEQLVRKVYDDQAKKGTGGHQKRTG